MHYPVLVQSTTLLLKGSEGKHTGVIRPENNCGTVIWFYCAEDHHNSKGAEYIGERLY